MTLSARIPDRIINEYVKNLYLTDEYIIRNPSLHEEDSPWKVGRIIPFIDKFAGQLNKQEINLLDVGGGAGLILNAISAYLTERHRRKVNKYALDLSPGMLEVQKKRNPDLKKALNEDIRKTSLADKEIDLTLMIDILEHVPDPADALEEVRRFSGFAILKVPLEDNLFLKTVNFLKRGRKRKHSIEAVGHINVYNFSGLKRQVEKHAGRVLDSGFTNVFDYALNSEHYRNKMGLSGKLINSAASFMHRLSPRWCSLGFGDYAVMLVGCA
jgi:SAM-dependent methyltransferase